MRRRYFFAACAAAPLFSSRGHATAPFPVKFKQEPPYASVMELAEPGHDEFPGEKTAMEIETRLASALASGDPPLAAGCGGSSPAPSRYRNIAHDVAAAVFDSGADPVAGWKQWRASLGTVRRAAFYALPGDLVRYDVRSRGAGRLDRQSTRLK